MSQITVNQGTGRLIGAAISFFFVHAVTAGMASAKQERSYRSMALLVASSRPGPGQQELKYPSRDVARLRSVLTEIGGYSPDDVRILLDPSASRLLEELTSIASELAETGTEDQDSAFLFYYSGHARASGLDLGDQEVPLEELKQRLASIPADLKIVVLDACQSGAMSNVKGARPATSFSYNSVAGLNTKGMVVMASSTANELSQESDEIGGSYFTHHLVSGLWGAADRNMDGRITLSEAYDYVYNRTLVSTAATAVGGQHVTLETELKGKGEMVMSYPADAKSGLWFDSDLDADILVYTDPERVVVAEVYKSGGGRLRIALPPGRYAALVRSKGRVLRCSIDLEADRTADLDVTSCDEVAQQSTTAKAYTSRPDPRYSLELGLGAIIASKDRYNDMLETFGFQENLFSGSNLYFQATLLLHLGRHVALGLTYSDLDHGDYTRKTNKTETTSETSTFEWMSHRLGARVRASWPLLNYWLTPYVQAGGGLTVVRSKYIGPNGKEDVEYHYGYHIDASFGLSTMFWRYTGMFLEAGYVFAPALENLLGDTHDSGGFMVALGFRGAL